MRHSKLFAPMNAPELVSAKVEALRSALPDSEDFVLLSEKEAAELIGVRPPLLSRWRTGDEGPAYSKIGRTVVYRLDAVLEFIEWRREWLDRMSQSRKQAEAP